MALVGTLKDIGIIDLIQFPHQGRRSGCLSISSGGDLAARLHYQQGSLVHAECGAYEGLDALVPLVDLQEASFSFDVSDSPTKKTIDVELHLALLQTLKIRDEQRAAEADAQTPPAPETNLSGLIQEQLALAVEKSPWLAGALVVNAAGEVVSSAMGPMSRAIQDAESLTTAFSDFIASIESPVSKVLVERGDGMAMSVGLCNGMTLLAFASSGAVMGAVVSTVTRIGQNVDAVIRQ